MNQQLLNKLRGMNEAELYSALYKDHLTGAYNRQAFEGVDFATVAIVDMDSLKYLNDTYGHDVGNNYLVELAAVLRNIFGDDNVYRLGGDEFAVTGNTATGIRRKLNKVRLLFPGFTAGIGMTIAEADDALLAAKEQRENCGQRATRGECPPWLANNYQRSLA
jgi:predicted signal transduction protein with EAL and GGDEF domain